MKCEDRKDLMLLYLVDVLEPTEQAELRSHLDTGCPTCHGSLAQAQAILTHLSMSLDPVQPNPQVRQKLLHRIATQPRTAAEPQAFQFTPQPPSTTQPAPRRRLIPRLAAPIAAAILAGVATYWFSTLPVQQKNHQLTRQLTQTQQQNTQLAAEHANLQQQNQLLADQQNQLRRQHDQLAAQLQDLQQQNTQLAQQHTQLQEQTRQLQAQRDQLAGQFEQARQINDNLIHQLAQMDQLQTELADKNQQIINLQTQIESVSQMQKMIRSSSLKIASLQDAGPQPNAHARVFWDVQARKWHFFAANLTPPAPGKTYELWFITPDQRKIPAGTFDVDHAGQASLVVDLPPGVDNFALAAVTDEPVGGAPQPTGQIQLAGKIE